MRATFALVTLCLAAACSTSTTPLDAESDMPSLDMAVLDAGPSDLGTVDGCAIPPHGNVFHDGCGWGHDAGLPPVGTCDGRGVTLCAAEAQAQVRACLIAWGTCVDGLCERADHCSGDWTTCTCGDQGYCPSGYQCVSTAPGERPWCTYYADAI